MATSLPLLQLDAWHAAKEYNRIYELTSSLMKNDVNINEFELLWRHARAIYDVSSGDGLSPKQHERLLRDGQVYANKCLSLNPNNFYSQKWTAVYISALTEYNGIKDKIKSAYTIKEHCDNANVLLGNDENGQKKKDSTVEHLLGRWCIRIASISWMERKLASAVIAKLPDSPEEATYANALEHFLAADSLKADFVINALWIGHTYRKLGDNSNAKKWYRKAVHMKQKSSSDKTSAKEAKKIMSKL